MLPSLPSRLQRLGRSQLDPYWLPPSTIFSISPHIVAGPRKNLATDVEVAQTRLSTFTRSRHASTGVIAIGTGVVHGDGRRGFRAHDRGRSPPIVVPPQLHLWGAKSWLYLTMRNLLVSPLCPHGPPHCGEPSAPWPPRTPSEAFGQDCTGFSGQRPYLDDAMRDCTGNLRDFVDCLGEVSSFDHGKSGDRILTT